MTFIRRTLAATGVAAISIALLSAPAEAQATRTWVSGVGDDANPCSRTAPCKTWAGAISKTAEGGVINALDSGGFGQVTITRAITLDGGSTTASTLATAGNGITIDAAASSDVVLRNLDISGVKSAETCAANDGVRIVNARSVRLDDVSISGFKRAVNAPLTSSSADIFVDLAFNDLDVFNNCEYGVRIAPDAGHHSRATIDGSVITGSNVALSIAAGGEAWVSGSKFYLNNLGVQSDGGPIHSLCNNAIAGNASPGAFTDEAQCGSPAAPASPVVPTPPSTPSAPVATPGVKYCSVPKLTGLSVTTARAKLKEAGCKLGTVTKQKASRSKQHKKVLSQNVPARVQVKRGTSVSIRVGK